MTLRRYCSEAAPAEPLAGTADPTDVWILLEYRPAWTARALSDNSLAPEVLTWLRDGVAAIAATGLRVRPQFIRQPERAANDRALMIGRPGNLVEFRFPDDQAMVALDLVRAVEAARSDAPVGATRLTAPHYFVCTNGQRDVCCARFGLPVYAALRARVGARVWQITHVGGHRFAPNVLVLPQHALYGRVHPARLDDWLATLESGRLAFAELRGRTDQPAAAQAAEVFLGLDDLRLRDVRAEVLEGVPVSVVRFDAPHGLVEVTVQADESGPLVQPSCGAALEHVTVYRRYLGLEAS